jgi:hypothetical protein
LGQRILGPKATILLPKAANGIQWGGATSRRQLPNYRLSKCRP